MSKYAIWDLVEFKSTYNMKGLIISVPDSNRDYYRIIHIKGRRVFKVLEENITLTKSLHNEITMVNSDYSMSD